MGLRLLYIEGEAETLRRAEQELAQGEHVWLFAQDLGQAAEILLGEPFDAAIIGSGIEGPDLTEWIGTLRAIERRNCRPVPALIVRLVAETTNVDTPGDGAESSVDCPWTDTSDYNSLLTRVCAEVARKTRAPEASRTALPLEVLEIEQFREQVGYDDELLVEIVDLFLAERKEQVPGMRATLEAGNFELFARQVHTIKGSLSSLHASIARARAQELETAAKARDGDSCYRILGQLEHDLDTLEYALLEIRARIGTL